MISDERLAELIRGWQNISALDVGARELVAALRELLSLRKGDTVIVPREPTALMSYAGVEADDCRTGHETVKHIYRAMIAASEAAPISGGAKA